MNRYDFVEDGIELELLYRKEKVVIIAKRENKTVIQYGDEIVPTIIKAKKRVLSPMPQE